MKRAIQQTFMVSALAFAVNQAFALPKEPTIVNGNVQITPSSNAMEIQHSAGAIVNWKGFDIDNGQTVKFVAPNEQAAILNRVVSGNQASTWISGRLESNGRVFLINPNGIIFGYSSVVDVGGLVASTLNITNENFLANNWLFESTGKKNGISINTGSQINIKPNSYLWLFGNRVTNMSTINAQASMVVMAAGEKVYVSENDSSNMFFEVTPNSSIDLSVSDNSIMINEDASVDVMQGGSFGAFGHNVIQAGSIYLDAASVDGGNAIFSARNNLSLYNSSKIYTSGAGQQSGSVYLQAGNQLTIDSGSSIRVNGDFGGQDGWLTMTAGQIDDNGSVNAGSSNLVVRNYAYNTLATPFFTTLKSNGQQIVIAAGSEFLPPASPVVTPPAPSGTPVTTGVGTVSPPPSTTTTTASSTQSTVEGGGAVTPRQSSQPSSTEVTGTQAGTATNGAGGTSTTPVSMPPSTGGSVVIVPDDDIAAPSSSGTPRATEVNTGVTVDPTSQVATGNPIDVTITNPNPPRLPPQVSTGSQSGVTESGVVTEGASSGVVTSSGVISSGVSGSVTATPVGSANIDNNQPPQVATGAGQTDTQTVLGATTNGNQPPQANGSGQTSTINQGSINGNTPTTPLNNTNPTPPAIQPQTAQQYLATKDRSQLQALGTQFANAPIGSSVTINVVDANGMSIPISRLEWLTALRANNVETNFGSNTGSTTTPSTVPSSTTVSGAVLTGGGTPASQGTTQATNTTPSNPTTTTTNGGAASSPNNVTGSTPVSVIQNPAVPLNPTTSIPVGSRPTTGNGSVAVNNNTTAPITVIPPTPTVRPQTIQEYFANKDRNEIKRLFANAPLGNSTIYVTDQYGFSLPVTRKEWIAVMNQKGAIVNDLQSDLEFLKTLSSSEAQNLWNNYNLGYIGESNTAAYPLSNGESRFISRTAWDKDQNRRSQEIFSRNQQAEATAYVQNVSQAKLNDLRVNFDQQAYHSVFGNNAQDNKVIVGLPSGNYGISKAELDQEQARRNVIETERQNKLAAQRALQAQKEQANSNNFSGSVGSQALDLNYFSQKYQELTSQGKTADAAKLLNNAQALGFSNEAVKGNAQTGITAEQWYAFEDAHYQQQVQQPKQPEKASETFNGVVKGVQNIGIDLVNQGIDQVNFNHQQEMLRLSEVIRISGDDAKADQYIAANKPAMSSVPSKTYDNQYQQQGGYIVEATQVVNSLKNPKPVIKNIDNPAGKLKSVETKDLKVAKVDTGSKGNWDSSINTKNLQANTRYELSNGHTYITDNAGRVNKVEANLSDAKSMDRNTYQQRDVGKSVNSTGDDGGHLIASSLGGAGDRINLVPQASTLNRGDWKSMEAQLARELKNDKSVNIKIDVGYPTGNTVRPNTFIVTAIINNKEKIWRFTQ